MNQKGGKEVERGTKADLVVIHHGVEADLVVETLGVEVDLVVETPGVEADLVVENHGVEAHLEVAMAVVGIIMAVEEMLMVLLDLGLYTYATHSQPFHTLYPTCK